MHTRIPPGQLSSLAHIVKRQPPAPPHSRRHWLTPTQSTRQLEALEQSTSQRESAQVTAKLLDERADTEQREAPVQTWVAFEELFALIVQLEAPVQVRSHSSLSQSKLPAVPLS